MATDIKSICVVLITHLKSALRWPRPWGSLFLQGAPPAVWEMTVPAQLGPESTCPPWWGCIS